jgi:hypothetical protein
MLRPQVSTWLKQSGQFSRVRIETGDVWTFVQITGEARPREVRRNRRATMFFGDDMIEMKGKF